MAFRIIIQFDQLFQDTYWHIFLYSRSAARFLLLYIFQKQRGWGAALGMASWGQNERVQQYYHSLTGIARIPIAVLGRPAGVARECTRAVCGRLRSAEAGRRLGRVFFSRSSRVAAGEDIGLLERHCAGKC